MSHTGVLKDSFTYVLSGDTETAIEDFGDGTGEVVTVVTYVEPVDEDGYAPPKYMIIDGAVHDYAKDALGELGLFGKWEPLDEYDFDSGWSMETIYVFDKILKAPVDKATLKSNKMTKLKIRVKSIESLQGDLKRDRDQNTDEHDDTKRRKTHDSDSSESSDSDD